MNIATVQERLVELGLYSGPIDGVPGRALSISVAAFQQTRAIPVQWPGTIGPKTLAALFPAAPQLPMRPPWFDLVLSKKGLHEKRDYSALSAFLKSDGRTLGDPRVLPWCGDLVETCLAVTLREELLPPNPYLARNWTKFGQPCEPRLGAIVIFWRGSPTSINGHVGILAGVSEAYYYVLGGNQTDAITVAPIAKGRLVVGGCRWPKTYPVEPRRALPQMAGGVLSLNEA